MSKTMTIDQFLTKEQIDQAHTLYRKCKRDVRSPAHMICEEIIKPNIQVMNKKLGQANEPMFLAYSVQYVFDEFVNSK